MSRWSYGNEHGDRIVVRDGDGSVMLIATTLLRPEDAIEEEATAALSLPPDVARDMAQWLVLYADSVDHARGVEPGPPLALQWWDGAPPVPEVPTRDDARKAMQILVCTSPRNVTELGWYPATMDVDEALKIVIGWHTWASEVSKRYKENKKE